MSLLNKQIISEKTLTIWFAFSAFSGIAFILAGSLYLHLIHDCWPLRGIHPGQVDCLSQVLPPYLYLLPAVLGAITGTLLTKIYMQKTPDQQN